MTLTQLKYVVAVARERHFARASAACFVSQPTLSVAIKKLEEELGITIFERGTADVGLTALGEQIVAQAQRVLEQAQAISELAKQGKDPLSGPFRLGLIYTIGPYLLPQLVPALHQSAPQMPLFVEETFTSRLLELLKQGAIDAAILALPFSEPGIEVAPLYDEEFVVAMPSGHAWEKRRAIPASDLKNDTMLILGAGHCFRDQVLQTCPEVSRTGNFGEGLQRTFEGSSLETIRHMVASGVGITVMPASAVPDSAPRNGLLAYRPFVKPIPQRRVVLAWRASFTRRPAIEAIRKSVARCRLNGTHRVSEKAKT
jgi:LysR family hydrogen peroxide-inducible transcriptional activator